MSSQAKKEYALQYTIGPVKKKKKIQQKEKQSIELLPYEYKSMNDSDQELGGWKVGGFHTLRHFQHFLREVTQDSRNRILETCKSQPSL